jgi:hypothetical protein
MRFSTLSFFPPIKPPWALIIILKYFLILFQLRRDIRKNSMCRLQAPPHSAESRLCAMRHSAESIFVIKYLCKYESIFETASACLTGDPEVLFAKNQV